MARDPLIGVALEGRWRVDAVLGVGGGGVVYEGRQLNVTRPVAIKVLIDGHDPERLARFSAEARIAANLHHPHIVEIHDVGVTPDGRPFIAMERLSGQSLASQIEDSGALSVRDTLLAARDVADALVVAHGAGVVHRDLKPDNIFMHQAGDRMVVKVLDFGIAKEHHQSLTVTGAVSGTPHYMSPEQAMAQPVGPTSDLYSLGVVLFECLAGRTLFKAETPLAVLLQHVNTAPPTLAEVGVAVPKRVEALVTRLLSKAPGDRYPSARVLRAALDEVLAGLSGPDVPPVEGPPSRGAALPAALLAVAVAALAWWLVQVEPGAVHQAGPDAAVRADAALIDASLVDAAPDARVPDAAAPDAQVPDARVQDARPAVVPDARVRRRGPRRAPRTAPRAPASRAPATVAPRAPVSRAPATVAPRAPASRAPATTPPSKAGPLGPEIPFVPTSP